MVDEVAAGPPIENVEATEVAPEDAARTLEERVAALEAASLTQPAEGMVELAASVQTLTAQMADLQPVVDAIRELRREETRPRNREGWFRKKLW